MMTKVYIMNYLGRMNLVYFATYKFFGMILQQEGSLCAQHCLNALLQAQYFSAVDLADIARQLDESERLQMAEAGTQSIEYQRFIQVCCNRITIYLC